MVIAFSASLVLHRLHLQPQATLRTQDQLGQTANRTGGFRIGPRRQAKPEQSQRHDDSQLSQGELLTDAIPVKAHKVPVRTFWRMASV